MFVGGLFLLTGLTAAGGVYYEQQKKWAKKQRVLFRLEDLDPLWRAVQQGQWELLRALPSVSGRAAFNLFGVSLLIEYPADQSTESVYVTVENKTDFSGAIGLFRALGVCRKHVINQRRLSPESALKLSHILGLSLGKLLVIETLSERRQPPAFAPVAPHGGAWHEDFRQAAMVASLRLTSKNSGAKSLENVSLCLPVSSAQEGQLPLAGISSRRSLVILSGGTVVSFVLAVLLAQDGLSTGGSLAVFLLGLVLSMAAVPLDAWLTPGQRVQKLREHLLLQGGSMLDPLQPAEGLEVNVWDGHTYQPTNKQQPEDYGICEFDWARQRLLIEGFRYHYVIRAEDVSGVKTLTNAETVSVELTYAVGGVPLRLVLSWQHGTYQLARHRLLRVLCPSCDAQWMSQKIAQTLSLRSV